ncbi:MAG: hypothetical protein M3R17_04105 [Bacteroidota bacterium]|nr:hypothetical protein [Bacteroidota bacterium]
MKHIVFSIILLSVLIASCKTKKAPGKESRKGIQTLTIAFYPPWGGSAEAIVERKEGKTNLYSTYHQKIDGIDTVLTAVNLVNKLTADSIYAYADSVKWNDDANRGTAVTRVGLKFNMSLKKGRNQKSVAWENLKNASELPTDILKLTGIVNRIAPPDFKIY